jgi:DNA-binding CsgD family transcriptional regulator
LVGGAGVGASLSERLVGREAELTRLEQFLDAERPSARTLVLSGGAGFGKTALWEAGVASARRSGTTALVARPSEPETRLGFAALSDLLEAVDEDVFAALPGPQRHALEVALLRSEPSDRPPEARAIAAGFLGALRELASGEPVVVAVDDIQWLDAASAGALRFAQRRLDDEPIVFLLTERAAPATVPLGVDGPERLSIGGLSMGAIRLLLAERLDFHPQRQLLRRIYESTGGNPLFALEVARNLLETDRPIRPEQPLAVPSELGALLGQRLAKLSAPARTAALGAALASEPTTELIESVLGADSAGPLGELVSAGVVEVQGDRIHFTHPLLASTVTAAAVPRRRRAMQHQLAGLVDDPVASARHLARASVEPDEGVADLLEGAAVLARARGGWDTAAELLECSRDLTPMSATGDRPRRALAAAEHHAHAGDRSRARGLVEELLAEPLPRAERANGLRLLAEISAEDENFGGAIAVYEQALEFVDDPLLEAAVEDGLAYVCACSWDVAALAHAHRALELVELGGDEMLMGRPLAVCAMVDFMFGRGVAWDKVERALALEDREAVTPLQARPSTIAALLHIYTGDHAEGRRQLTEVWTWAADHGDEGDLAFILVFLSWLETRSGDFATAALLAEQAEVFAGLTGSQSTRAWAVGQRAFVWAHQGEVARAREAADEAIALGGDVGFLLPRVWAGASLALLEVSLGDPEAAWRACEELTAPFEALGIAEPILPFFLPDAVEGLIALGQLDRAERLVSSLEGRGRELDRPWALATGARGRGLLLAARGDLVGSAAALAGALAVHDRLDMPFERARTLFVTGLVERRARQRAKARSSLGEALEAFERLGARLWTERARAELARVSGRRAGGSGELTPTEARVAELAAGGLSNKEIAEALFVSVHTVESHLSHAYSKLGVRSRSQLGRRLGRPQ